MADDLFDAGVRRVNISLDTLDLKVRHHEMGQPDKVLAGLRAQSAGLGVKIALLPWRDNGRRSCRHLAWAARGFDMTIIEVMPMGDNGSENGSTSICRSLAFVRPFEALHPDRRPFRTGGPARYVKVEETGQKLASLPADANFCESRNRVRVTRTGQLYMCLGQDDNADLRALREGGESALDTHCRSHRTQAQRP